MNTWLIFYDIIELFKMKYKQTKDYVLGIKLVIRNRSEFINYIFPYYSKII